MDETAEATTAWSDTNNDGHTIFQAGHVATVGIPSRLGVNPHPAVTPLSGHHRIPPHQHIYREV